MLETFKKFLADPSAADMFVTGRAGTGKTTDLRTVIEYLNLMGWSNKYAVCAYTHKACGVLAEKLPPGTNIITLHSFLKKRPTINQEATKLQHVEGNAVMGKSNEEIKLILVDEYSMIGEMDLMDVRAIQDEDDQGNCTLKTVWIGDPYQLPPVGDQFTLKPHGPYQVMLTKIYRQADGSPLLDVLTKVVSFIEGAKPEPLPESDCFQRGRDIVAESLVGPDDQVVLAFTNERVEKLNREIQGYALPLVGDKLFSPSTKQQYEFLGSIEPWDIRYIDMPYGKGGKLFFESKYRTLEHLLTLPDISFGDVRFGEEDLTLAYVFGHHQYKLIHSQLKYHAVEANKKCSKEEAQANPGSAKARARAKAWRDFLTFNECVVCLDFTHAMTVHKSQGSTYNTVYLDMQDINRAADWNYGLYLKLMYVGISRASYKVVTN